MLCSKNENQRFFKQVQNAVAYFLKKKDSNLLHKCIVQLKWENKSDEQISDELLDFKSDGRILIL